MIEYLSAHPRLSTPVRTPELKLSSMHTPPRQPRTPVYHMHPHSISQTTKRGWFCWCLTAQKKYHHHRRIFWPIIFQPWPFKCGDKAYQEPTRSDTAHDALQVPRMRAGRYLDQLLVSDTTQLCLNHCQITYPHVHQIRAIWELGLRGVFNEGLFMPRPLCEKVLLDRGSVCNAVNTVCLPQLWAFDPKIGRL